MEMTVSQAQADMRAAYCSGGAGILASGLVWTAAALSALLLSAERSVWVLLVGGMFIHPLGQLFCRLFGARAAHASGNPFAALAGASTFWLIFSLPLAFGLSLQRIEWFFPAMLLVIGGRYLVFATLFGMALYWALGLALAAAGVALGKSLAAPMFAAAAGAAIELVFAVICLLQHRRAQAAGTAAAASAAG